MTSSMLEGSILDRSTTALMGIAARSSARTLARLPPCLPTGVLSAAQIKASFTRRPRRSWSPCSCRAPLCRLAASHEPGAILRARGDVREHGFLLPLGHDRAEPCVLVERVAGRELLRPLGELLDHLVVHRALDQETGSGGADFSLPVENPALGTADRRGQVRIRENDVRTLAA